MRWHRRLVAQKWNFAKRRGAGRPSIMRHISELIVHMAAENPSWGYTRIEGALTNLTHKVGRGTIANVLRRNGIEPAPERRRRTQWSTFLKAHWKVLAASDFFTVEVWTGGGLVTHYVLFMISLAYRVVKIAASLSELTNPGCFRCRATRLFTGGRAGAKRYLILDRDTKYSKVIPVADWGKRNERHWATADVAEPEPHTQCGSFARSKTHW